MRTPKTSMQRCSKFQNVIDLCNVRVKNCNMLRQINHALFINHWDRIIPQRLMSEPKAREIDGSWLEMESQKWHFVVTNITPFYSILFHRLPDCFLERILREFCELSQWDYTRFPRPLIYGSFRKLRLNSNNNTSPQNYFVL